MEVARRVFAEQEYELLMRLPESDRPEAFFELWTLKESCSKLLGQGLSLPWHSMSFASEDDGTCRLLGETAYARHYDLAKGYEVCACAQDRRFSGLVLLNVEWILRSLVIRKAPFGEP
jgi:4'-phosphopantetheinyl transferase